MRRVVALTGATGFIGRETVNHLVGAGFHVKVLVRPTSDTSHLPSRSTEQISGSLQNRKSLVRLIENVEAVIHCAGTTRGSTSTHFYPANVEGVSKILEATQEHAPIPRLLHISSLAAREPHLSPYAASKHAGELVLLQADTNCSWGILRPPAVYGPGDRELLPLLQWMAKGYGVILGPRHARFSLLFVRDLANAVLYWLNTPTCPSAIYELHDGKIGGYSWTDVIHTIARLTNQHIRHIRVPSPFLYFLALANQLMGKISGHPAMLTTGKVRELLHPDWVCDNKALTDATGWAPKYSLEKGIAETLDLPKRTG